MINEQALVKQAAEIEASLSHFHGSETFYRHWTGRLTYTEGIKHLADAAECYWLIDAIWYLLLEGQDAVPWIPVEGEGAVLTCWRDTPEEDSLPPIRQNIEFSDFALPQIKLYVSMGVLMLPAEY